MPAAYADATAAFKGVRYGANQTRAMKAAAIAHAKPPKAPSSDLRGEIVVHGRMRPHTRPTTYAPVSQLHVTKNARNTNDAPIA